VQVGGSLPTCTRHGHRHRVTATRLQYILGRKYIYITYVMLYVAHEPKNIQKVISKGSSIVVYETIASKVTNENVMDK